MTTTKLVDILFKLLNLVAVVATGDYEIGLWTEISCIRRTKGGRIKKE